MKRFTLPTLALATLFPGVVYGIEVQNAVDFTMNDRHNQLNPEYNSPYSILNRAITLSCTSCKTNTVGIDMSKTREVLSISSMNRTPNVFVGGLSAERESMMRIIPVNIDGGISGIRVLLTSESGKKRLRTIHDLDTLRKMKIGQVAGWPDATTLKNNGISVEISNNLDSLFDMLKAGRFDAILWSAIEAFPNMETLKARGIYVNTDYKICYPSGKFFYVSKNDSARYSIILNGLKTLESNGELYSINDAAKRAMNRQFSKDVKTFKLTPSVSDTRTKDPCLNG